MAFHYSPKIITNGLKIYIDPANRNGYPGTGNILTDMAPASSMTYSIIDQAFWTTSNNGIFSFPAPIGSATASCVQSSEIVSQRLNKSEMSFDVWFKRNSVDNFYNMIWAAYLPYLSFTSNNRFYFSWGTLGPGQQVLQSTKTYSNDIWYNVCCTLTQNLSTNTSVAKIYVNGVLEATSPTYTISGIYNVPYSENKLVLGNWRPTSYPFVGQVSCFKFYDRILSDSEIFQNYIALKSRFGL
jgi:hypothetical protein